MIGIVDLVARESHISTHYVSLDDAWAHVVRGIEDLAEVLDECWVNGVFDTHMDCALMVVAKVAAYMRACRDEGRLELIDAMEEHLAARYICAEEAILRPAREAARSA